MKFFGKEVPPRSKPEAAPEEYGIRPEEPMFRPKPEALDVSSLVEKAKAGDAIEMVPELDEYFDGWLHYAQDRNLFSGSAEMHVLAQARRAAIQLAREKKFDELQSKLEELSGPLAESIEHAAEENLTRIQEGRDATPREHREHLAEAIQEVEGVRQPKETASKQEATLERDAEREMRAQKFAEKYDIVAEREALLIAEENYAEAIRKRNESFFKLKMRDDAATKGQREILESAIQTWREALTKVSEEARKGEDTKHDAITARFLSARDAMMRMEQVRQRAVAEGLDNRSKTAIGKVDAWANRLNAKLFSGVAAAGRGFGKVSEAVGGTVVGRFLDKEADAEKYKRASRIVGSAAIMTAVFAPFGAVTAGAAGMTFVWRTARGLLGWGVGSAAGAGAGKLYDVRHGSKDQRLRTHQVSQEDLLAALKSGRIEVLSQKAARQLYKEGSTAQFKKSEQQHQERKMRAEVATSTLVAGVSAYGLSHFPPVHEALTIHPASTVHPMPSAPLQPHAPVLEQHGATAHVPETVIPSVHIESVSVHGSVNDADKLFGRFVDNAKAQFPNPEVAPPALRTLLEQYHHVDGVHQEDVLTKFLHLQNGGSVVVHPGDTLSYENGKVIFQGHELIDEHGTVHNLREDGEVHIMHPHAEQAPSLHEHVEKAAPASPAAATSPVTPAAAEPHPAISSQPAPMEVPPPAPVPEHIPPVSEHAVPAPEHAPVSQPSPEHVAPVPAPEHVVPSPAPEQVPQPTHAPEHVAPAAPPAHEVPSNDNTPPPAPESAIPSVEQLTHSPLWGMAHTREAYTLFDTPVPASAFDAASFRQNLFDLMRTSGVGPGPHETVDHYLARAEAAIAKGNVVKPVIVQTPDQQMLIAHGGDVNARMLLTREFLREYYDAHPDTNVNVVVENDPGTASRGFIVTTESVEATKDDTIYYPTFEEAHVGDHHKAVLPTVTPDMQVIF